MHLLINTLAKNRSHVNILCCVLIYSIQPPIIIIMVISQLVVQLSLHMHAIFIHSTFYTYIFSATPTHTLQLSHSTVYACRPLICVTYYTSCLPSFGHSPIQLLDLAAQENILPVLHPSLITNYMSYFCNKHSIYSKCLSIYRALLVTFIMHILAFHFPVMDIVLLQLQLPAKLCALKLATCTIK